jgi:hypothetical protein
MGGHYVHMCPFVIPHIDTATGGQVIYRPTQATVLQRLGSLFREFFSFPPLVAIFGKSTLILATLLMAVLMALTTLLATIWVWGVGGDCEGNGPVL